MLRAILFSGLVLVSGSTRSAGTVFSSGPAPVAVLELYTTEGCSSCPPAEAWLAQLRDDPRLWREWVPVAFHVTYFDTRDWQDRFGKKSFAERQRSYAAAWPTHRVYTPCLVRNGIEWEPPGKSDTMNSPGVLTAAHEINGRVQVKFQPTDKKSKNRYEVYVAFLGGGIVADVRGGENAGRTLTHEFVALVLQKKELTPAADGAVAAELELAEKETPAAPHHALAVWITQRGELTPLQATGGWLD